MKLPLIAVLCAASLSACAQSSTPDAKAVSSTAAATTKGSADARVRAAIQKMDPKIQIDRLAAAPMPGFREVIISGQVLYVSDDGRYLMQGSLYDMNDKKDLSQVGMSAVRREELSKVPASDKIVFAPAKPRHTVEVFTDIECGYCRKLHQDIAIYNRLGIAIEYLAFPRAGLDSPDFHNMESVWCSADRQKALTDAKNGLPAPAKTCTNPVASQYKMGQRLGLQGTPMIITSDGIALPGYMPPDLMLKTLDKLAAEAQAKPKAGEPAASAGGR